MKLYVELESVLNMIEAYVKDNEELAKECILEDGNVIMYHKGKITQVGKPLTRVALKENGKMDKLIWMIQQLKDNSIQHMEAYKAKGDAAMVNYCQGRVEAYEFILEDVIPLYEEKN